MSRLRKRPTPPRRQPMAISEEPPRRVILPIETPDGAPVMGWAAGSRRRPVIRALVSFAALAAGRDA